MVAHTASSRLLASDPTLGAYIECSLEEVAPAASYMAEAMQEWPGSQEPNQSGWNIMHRDERPMFVAIGADQRRAEKFANAMTWFNARPGLAVRHLTEEASIGWEKVGKVVDVGGSHGAVCTGLVMRYPGIQCVVQDLPQVISTADTGKSGGDLTFMAHDFFQEQPVKDADVYILRWVLHDWTDLYAVKILRALIPALKPGSRLIINETCLAEPGVNSLYEQRFPR